ncbi:MAG TPA: DUF5372 family protein [Planctomycetaceae bacterium]|nr:DUF5372 family protein [Planctomycetaceae bacterium]
MIIVLHSNRSGPYLAYFYDDHGRLSTVPLQWTTFAVPGPYVEISSGRSAFYIRDLLELAQLPVA